MARAVPICFMLETQEMVRACSRALAKTGNRIAARIAMIAITTSSSISVKPDLREQGLLVSMDTLARISRRTGSIDFPIFYTRCGTGIARAVFAFVRVYASFVLTGDTSK